LALSSRFPTILEFPSFRLSSILSSWALIAGVSGVMYGLFLYSRLCFAYFFSCPSTYCGVKVFGLWTGSIRFSHLSAHYVL
jgi:hypothetical protein